MSDHVYSDTSGEGKGNIGAIELPNFTIVVDSTISKKTATAFRRSLESQIQSPLRKLVITHHHADHTLGIPVFKDCEIIASEPYKKLKRTSKYQPTRTFEDTLILEDQDLQVEIVHAGGHSQDSSYVYFPKEKILFSGDIIFAKTFFYAGDRTFNPEKWRDVLRRLVERDIKRIIPGHGPLCSEEEAKRYLKFFEATSSIMKDLVQKGFNEREAVRYSEFPAFYPEYRKGVKELALSNWYRFYKRGKRRGS
ncbi:MAG: MBL fold metallo-hydrolase [Candidatus Bathyarchaeota archaeon]|nr:MBL fold metallo-hydrolase [Candidatus Bathyarchaeota archaeon]